MLEDIFIRQLRHQLASEMPSLLQEAESVYLNANNLAEHYIGQEIRVPVSALVSAAYDKNAMNIVVKAVLKAGEKLLTGSYAIASDFIMDMERAETKQEVLQRAKTAAAQIEYCMGRMQVKLLEDISNKALEICGKLKK